MKGAYLESEFRKAKMRGKDTRGGCFGVAWENEKRNLTLTEERESRWPQRGGGVGYLIRVGKGKKSAV